MVTCGIGAVVAATDGGRVGDVTACLTQEARGVISTGLIAWCKKRRGFAGFASNLETVVEIRSHAFCFVEHGADVEEPAPAGWRGWRRGKRTGECVDDKIDERRSEESSRKIWRRSSNHLAQGGVEDGVELVHAPAVRSAIGLVEEPNGIVPQNPVDEGGEEGVGDFDKNGADDEDGPMVGTIFFFAGEEDLPEGGEAGLELDHLWGGSDEANEEGEKAPAGAGDAVVELEEG